MSTLVQLGGGRWAAEHLQDVERVWNSRLHPNFAPHEFRCRCANDGEMGRCEGRIVYDETGVAILQALREHMGAPILINSAVRCPAHNTACGGAPRSQHRALGIVAPTRASNPWAVDISTIGHDRGKLFQAAQSLGRSIAGRPVSFGLGGRFLHMDLRPGRLWFYSTTGRRLWEQSGLTFT